MLARPIFLTALRHCGLTACIAVFDLGRLFLMAVRPRAALAAENLFLWKQLALFQERKVKPRRADDGTRPVDDGDGGGELHGHQFLPAQFASTHSERMVGHSEIGPRTALGNPRGSPKTGQ
jgi:hypothetical protein